MLAYLVAVISFFLIELQVLCELPKFFAVVEFIYITFIVFILSGGSRKVQILTQRRTTGSTAAATGTEITPRSKTSSEPSGFGGEPIRKENLRASRRAP